MGPKLMSFPCNAIVVVSFLAFFIAMTVIAFTRTEDGLRISDIALSNSYQREYIDLQETYFKGYAVSHFAPVTHTQYDTPQYFTHNPVHLQAHENLLSLFTYHKKNTHTPQRHTHTHGKRVP